MNSKFKQILNKAGYVLTHYTFVLLMAILAAVCFTILIDNSSLKESNINFYTRFGIVSTLGISLLFALNMLAERIGKKIILNVLGIVFLMGYFQFFLPHDNNDFKTVYVTLLAVSFVLSHLLVSFIAFLGKNKEYAFWQFNKNLFINAVVTGIFTIVLVGGIMLAISAVDHLFDLNLDNKIYPRTFAFLSIFGSCFIFLLFIEDGLSFLEKEGKYPEILKFFVQFILIPLLIIYAIILYFYGSKILIRWELPRGWVSYLILAYSLIGIFALLLVFPLKNIATKSWVKGFSKIFYYTLLPLLVLLYVAIFTRILEYGFTEKRYYILFLAVWLTIIVLYFSFWKNPNIKFIPITLFAFGLFSLAFPYFNTFSVSKNSQKKELKEILSKNHLLEKGKINFEKPIDDLLVIEICDKFDYLNERNEDQYLMEFISDKNKTDLKKDRPFTFSKVQSMFKDIRYNNYEIPGSTILSVKNLNYDVKGFDRMFTYTNYNDTDFSYEGNIFSIKGFSDPLTLYYNGKSINLSPEIHKIIDQYKNQKGEIYPDEISFIKEVGPYKLKFLLDEISYNEYTGNKGTYYISNDIIVLIKKK